MTVAAAGALVIGEHLWTAARGFASGVSVVTVGSGERVHGSTVSCFSVVSRDPPLASVSLRRNSFLLDMIRGHRSFVINVLAGDQATLARRFASRHRAAGRAQFDAVSLSAPSVDGVPIIAGTVCWLCCRPTTHVSAGDHELVLGEVVSLGGDGGVPLLYLAGSLRSANTLIEEASP